MCILASNKLTFRLLRADEIEARISRVNENGCQVLLYKDARCDMSILDETVGPLNWKRSHSRDNQNCTVLIWDETKNQWISKEDTGTESNTEAQKGLASDSFKRACVNWGIGRELYTTPFIWFKNNECNIKPKGHGFTCSDKFKVNEIQHEGNKIVSVTITNTDAKVTKTFGTRISAAEQNAGKTKVANQAIGKTKAKALEAALKERNVNIAKLCEQKGVTKLEELTEGQHVSIIRALNSQDAKASGKE